MKKKNALILAAAFALAAAPATLTATDFEDAYIDSYRNRTDIPVPVAVTSPRIDADYVGWTVGLEFTVDERGRPRDIVSDTLTAADLVDSVIDAVEHWRFKPLRNADGTPRPARVRLPVIIREPSRR